MGCLGNILWFIFGGCLSGLSWAFAGLLWCITIVGIPVGMQCFKFAALSFFPFGKEVTYGGGAGSFLLNIIWLIVSGFWLWNQLSSGRFCVPRSSASPLVCSSLNWPNWP